MIEREVSFIFSWASMREFIKKHHLEPRDEVGITDFYLDRTTRIRRQMVGKNSAYLVTRKRGDKASGARDETNVKIETDAAEILIDQAKLEVNKCRRQYFPLNDRYVISIDWVESPMRVAILEIEAATSHVSLPDAYEDIFHEKRELVSCPLSGWDYFRRKIGICGAPSSGKTETAKWLSHILNVNYGANAFHVMEYATTFIQKYRRTPGFDDSFLVWYGQRQREEDSGKAHLVISDCPTFLPYCYMLYHRPPKFDAISSLSLAKMYKRCLTDVLSYTDIVFLRLQKYQENGVRYHSAEEALRVQSMIQSFLNDHNIPHQIVDCTDPDLILRTLFYFN